MLELLAQPREEALLAPVVIEEMLIRLLCSPIGPRVANIGEADSSTRGVAKAVAWLRENISSP